MDLAGLSVSRLCFGTLPLSPIQGHQNKREAAELLCEAFTLGVNFLDTAQLYQNYDILYDSFRMYKACGGNPDKIVVSSKAYAVTESDAIRAVDEARTALRRDWIDIFLLHEQESEHTLRGHQEALETLYKLKRQGTVRAVGLSTHHVAGVNAAARAGLDVVHPILNHRGLGIVDGTRQDMENAISAAIKQNVSPFLMKVFGGGNLHREAGTCLQYALQWNVPVALGLRDKEELAANLYFMEHGCWQGPPLQRPRKLHIADWCLGCGRCVAVCPASALTVHEGKARCRDADCVLCGYCGAACSEFSIKIV